MSQRIVLLCLSLLLSHAAEAKRDTSEKAYQEARGSYYALKADAARRKLRHHWLKVAHQFEAVAADYPQSPRAPDALFTAAELLEELSRISRLEEDLKATMAAYFRLIEHHGRHRLADDAALALGRIQLDRLEDPEKAREVLEQSLRRNPKADRAGDIKTLLASVPSPKAGVKAPRVAEVLPAKPSRVEVARAAAKAQRSDEGKEAAPSPERDERKASVRSAQALAAAIGRLSREPSPLLIPAASLPAESTLSAADPAPREAPVPPPAEVVLTPAAEARLKAAARHADKAELTLAEQLGLKFRRVVIDAGHGGHDTGAIGKNGTREKDVSLAIAKALAKELSDRGLEVVLTRDADQYVRLEDRARLANEAKGDLFISVHCNSAAQRNLRGVETYTLNTSADRYSIRLAARENASSEKGISDLQFILADLATKANTDDSSRLAVQVQKSLVTHLSSRYSGIRSLGTKEALFYVLLGARMPAILVETSFLSNAEEEARLASPAYQAEVARSIAQGVEEFLGVRQKLATVH